MTPRGSLDNPETPNTSYPWVPWRTVRSTIDKLWDPENSPHHSIIGLTGSGKSYLVTKGILSLCEQDRVLVIDTKGDDKSVRIGRVVKKLPKHTWYSALGRRQDGPRDKWYRIVAPDNRTEAHEVIGEALSNAYDEGDWVIYVDETWEVTGRGEEGIGLEAVMSKIWRKGRSSNVSIVAATQTPVAVPRLFYDQASFAWIGHIRDEERQKRLLEIGGMSKKELPIISSLKKREWLVSANEGEYFARTVVE